MVALDFLEELELEAARLQEQVQRGGLMRRENERTALVRIIAGFL